MNLKYSIIFSYGKRSLTTAFLPSYPNCLRSVTAKYVRCWYLGINMRRLSHWGNLFTGKCHAYQSGGWLYTKITATQGSNRGKETKKTSVMKSKDRRDDKYIPRTKGERKIVKRKEEEDWQNESNIQSRGSKLCAKMVAGSVSRQTFGRRTIPKKSDKDSYGGISKLERSGGLWSSFVRRRCKRKVLFSWHWGPH